MAQGSVKVRVPGTGDVTLTDKDYIATGGEGTVYGRTGLVYKLFLDPAAARARGIEEKLQHLMKLKHPFIVSPLGPLENAKNEVVGFYMAQAEGVPLVKTFTNAWRDPNGFGMKESLLLVENMRQAHLFIHQQGVVTVDANEMNYHAHGVEPRLMDVDSWQVGRFKATAILPSIRDPEASQFDARSDWYSWAIVSFQVLAGIHPFKGRHPAFKRGDMLARMAAKVSVLSPDVTVNAGARDFHDIPAHLLEWYRAVFQDGLREPPPSVNAAPAAPRVRKAAMAKTRAATGLVHQVVLDLPGAVVHTTREGFALVRDISNGVLLLFDLVRREHLVGGTAAAFADILRGQAALVRTTAGVVLAEISPAGVRAVVIRTEKDPVPVSAIPVRPLPLSANRLAVLAGRLFAVSEDSANGLTELQVDIFGSIPVVSVRGSWPFLAKASRIFKNMATFDAMGAPFIVLPTTAGLRVEPCPALASHEVLDGFMASESTAYLVLLNRKDGLTYRVRVARSAAGGFAPVESVVTDVATLNIAATEGGLVLLQLEGGDALVANLKANVSKPVASSGLDEATQLLALPDGLHYLRTQTLVRVSTARS